MYSINENKQRRGIMQIKISDNLRSLADKFPCELYLVGGYIRNQLMNICNDDMDICSKLTLDEVENLLKNSKFSMKVKSKTLGTARIFCDSETYEYTTFRKEVYPNNGQHSPQEVVFIDDIREDAKRRDFTCNAIYYDIKNDRIIDFYDGIGDIKNRILKTVETPDYVLCHDGVRILRLFRFQCELNFKIDKKTLQGVIKYRNNLRDISGERMCYEIERILHSQNKYEGVTKKNSYLRTLKYFNKTSLWPYFGIDCPKIKFNMVKKVEHKSQGFLIDVIDTVNPISISYYLNLLLSNSFGLSKKMVENYINILSGYYEALNRVQNKPFFMKYFNNFPQIYLLLIHKSKYLANKYEFFYKYIIAHKLVVSVKDLQINGDDIKQYYPEVKASRYKPVLESLLSDVFDGKINNEKNELIQNIQEKIKYL